MSPPELVLGSVQWGLRYGIANAEAMLADDAWDRPGEAHLVYSWLVLQHLEDFELITTTVRRLAGALAADGVALLQFDTRRASAAYRLRNALPDVLLPRLWRRGIRRIRRKPSQLERLFETAGLACLDQQGADTELHVFVLRNTRR